MALNLLGPACTTGRRVVDLLSIDIIAKAMDHRVQIVQLRMIVNAIASGSQLKVS